jgi:hypothetical protein
LELRDALLHGRVAALEVVPVAPLGFRFYDAEHALAYYRPGADQMYLWWGNSVISYDGSPIVRFAAHFGRAAERAAAIASGVHARLRVIESDSNGVFIDRLRRAKFEFLGLTMISLLVLIDLVLRLRAYFAGRAFAGRRSDAGAGD